MIYEKEMILNLKDSISHLRSEGQYIQVAIESERLLRIGIETLDADIILSAHYSCALAYYYVNDFDKALFHIEAHHTKCQSSGSKKDWMHSYYLQFLINFFLNDFEQNRQLMENMLAIALEMDDAYFTSLAYINLSYALNKLHRYEEAVAVAETAMKYASLCPDQQEILNVRACLYLIDASINLNQMDTALENIERLEHLPVMNHFLREKAFLLVLKGRLYVLLKQPKKAFHFYTLAKKEDILSNDYLLLREIHKMRVELAEEICSFDELATIQKEYINLLHSIENKNWIKRALELKLRLQNSTTKDSAHIDYLTGVYNRRYLEETTNTWLLDAANTKESVVCIAFDVDDLKLINDVHGHLVGDEAIKQVAQICSEEIRKEDVLARFGGDEFVLVMQGISLENAKKKAELLTERVATAKLTDLPVDITISVGVADNVMRDVQCFKDLFHLADLALYRAKQNGKNQVVSFK